MAMTSNSKKDWLDSNGKDSKDSFQEYNQPMKAFRLAHPDNWKQGGHRVPEGQEGLPALVPTLPLPRVALGRYSAN